MDRIIIKNFGPIKEVDIPLKDFMVLIGPNASGKSTIAKLVYFWYSIYGELTFELSTKIFAFFRNRTEVVESITANIKKS